MHLHHHRTSLCAQFLPTHPADRRWNVHEWVAAKHARGGRALGIGRLRQPGAPARSPRSDPRLARRLHSGLLRARRTAPRRRPPRPRATSSRRRAIRSSSRRASRAAPSSRSPTSTAATDDFAALRKGLRRREEPVQPRDGGAGRRDEDGGRRRLRAAIMCEHAAGKREGMCRRRRVGVGEARGGPRAREWRAATRGSAIRRTSPRDGTACTTTTRRRSPRSRSARA